MNSTNPDAFNGGSTFDDDFLARLSAIEDEAKLLGESWSSICRNNGISRATPQRWRKEIPHTVTKVAEIEQYLRSRRKELEAAAVVPTK